MGENQSNILDPIKAGKKETHELFKAAMEQGWGDVVQALKKHPSLCGEKLTKSEQTALHIAVSCYDTDSKKSTTDLANITQIVNAIPKGTAVEVLRLKDANGNTPLHLAARLGSVSLCEEIALGRRELIAVRNNDNETPLFLAAQRGKLDAFICLRKIYKNVLEDRDERPDEENIESLCRAKDGYTILHSAISGEYFRLAYEIIIDVPNLVNAVNVHGQSPLHVLARKPNSFKSSSDLSFGEKIIYHYIRVRVPKLEDNHYASASCFGAFEAPFSYLWSLVGRFLHCHRLPPTPDAENPDRSINIDAENHEEQSKLATRAINTCIGFFISLIMPLLFLSTFGYTNIRKLQHKKEKHTWATQILKKIVEIQSYHGYYFDGKAPPMYDRDPDHIHVPSVPPSEDDDHSTQMTSSSVRKNKDEEEKVENGSGNSEAVSTNELLSITCKLTSRGAKMKQNQDVEERYYPEAVGISRAAKMKQNQDVEERDDDEVVEISRGNSQAVSTNDELLSITCKFAKIKENEEDGTEVGTTPFLIAAEMGITEIVNAILAKTKVAFRDVDGKGKNVLLLAIEHKQSKVLDFLLKEKVPDFVFEQAVDKEGNGPHHLAAMYQPNSTWRLPGAALQMYGEVTWFKHVKESLPQHRRRRRLPNKKGKTPDEIFRETHSQLAKDGTDWIIKTAESSSVVAALIATVAFATSVTVPGGFDSGNGYPIHKDKPEFVLFTVSSLFALWFSLCSLVFFLAIITSRCELKDFRMNLPRRLLFGLSSLFASIAAILVSFCAAHFFLLNRNLKDAALPIYVVTSMPPFIFAFAKLSLYIDLAQALFQKVPSRRNKVFYR